MWGNLYLWHINGKNLTACLSLEVTASGNPVLNRERRHEDVWGGMQV